MLINPEKYEDYRNIWEENIPLTNYKKAIERQSYQQIATILHKSFDSFRLDDEIMVKDNIVLEAVRYFISLAQQYKFG